MSVFRLPTICSLLCLDEDETVKLVPDPYKASFICPFIFTIHLVNGPEKEQTTWNGRLGLYNSVNMRYQKNISFVDHCKYFFVGGIPLDEWKLHQVSGFESHLPQWQVLSKFSFQHCSGDVKGYGPYWLVLSGDLSSCRALLLVCFFLNLSYVVLIF